MFGGGIGWRRGWRLEVGEREEWGRKQQRVRSNAREETSQENGEQKNKHLAVLLTHLWWLEWKVRWEFELKLPLVLIVWCSRWCKNLPTEKKRQKEKKPVLMDRCVTFASNRARAVLVESDRSQRCAIGGFLLG